MLGGIYTEENCSQCGARMVDNHRDAVCCPRHKKERARNLIVRFGRDFKKRTTNYDHACRMLTGIRFKFDEGTYDHRDYQASNPLGFEVQMEKYMDHKAKKIKTSTHNRAYRPLAKRLINAFGSQNVKVIGYGEIEEFLDAQKGIGDKARHELCTFLQSFMKWLLKHKRIFQIPEMPETPFVMGYRKIITKEVQVSILREIQRQNENNPRVYIGILWLSTYIKLRPADLLTICERHIDFEHGRVLIPTHKTEKMRNALPKVIALLPEDLKMIRRLPRAISHDTPFFRQDSGVPGTAAGTPFGEKRFYYAWKEACRVCGVEGVDLYGGTRHSSATALRKQLSFEDTKDLLGDVSDAALRYIQQDFDLDRSRYVLTRGEWSTSGTPEVTPLRLVTPRNSKGN